MKTEPLGTLRQDGESRTVRYERRYDATVEEVWAALTDPDLVRGWLAEMTIDPRQGGRVSFEWDGGHTQAGAVRIFDPPRTFAYTWEKGASSVIRFDLSADGDGTILTLEHTNIAPASVVSIGAGWHSHLEGLEALLAGAPTTSADWYARHDVLVPAYEEQAAAL